MGHIPKQLIQLPNTLLNIPDLALALDNEGFLEIDLVLRGETELLFLLEELPAAGLGAAAGGGGGTAFAVERGAVGGCGGAFFVEGGALEVLEFFEGGLEFAVEFGLCEALRGLPFTLVLVEMVYGYRVNILPHLPTV